MYAGFKWAAIVSLAAVSLAVTPDDSWAQRGRGGRGGWGRGGGGWSIGVGPGGVYGGYNQGGWYGNRGWYGGGRGWYGGRGFNGGNYYYPNNYGYYNGGYSYPTYSYGGTVYTTPSYNSTPSVATNAPPMRTGSGGDVVIMNSKDNGTALNYALNGHQYTIQPGQSQRIANDRQWVVEFDRGQGEGSARYSLSEGTFKFKSTDNGWELVRAADQGNATSHTTAKPALDDERHAPRTFNESDSPQQRDLDDDNPRDSLETPPEPQ